MPSLTKPLSTGAKSKKILRVEKKNPDQEKLAILPCRRGLCFFFFFFASCIPVQQWGRPSGGNAPELEGLAPLQVQNIPL